MRTEPSNRVKGNRLTKCAGGFVSSDLKAFLDKELSPFRMWYVGRHVSRCHECREEVVWLQRLGKNMRLLEDAHPRPELRARIMSTLPQMETNSVPYIANAPSRRTGAFGYALAGAFCLLVLTGALAALRAHTSTSSVTSTLTTNTAVKKPIRTKVSDPVLSRKQQDAMVAPVLPQLHDPTSDRANELVAMELKREKEQAALRLPDEWKQAIASVRTTAAQNKQSDPPYVQVAVDVLSVAAAQKKLIDWADAAKAVSRVVPADPNTHRCVSVLLTISPSSGAALLTQLKSVGAISEVTSLGTVRNPLIKVRPAAASNSEAIPDPRSIVRDRPKQTPISGHSIASSATKQTSDSRTLAGGIMVVVMLLPTS